MDMNSDVLTKTEEQRKAVETQQRKNVTLEMFRVFMGRGLLAKICLAIIVLYVFMAIFAPLLTPYGPYEQSLKAKFLPASAQHLLGTDQLGRDLFTRIIYGARISLLTGFISTCWGAVLGVTLGLIAGYSRGFVQQLIMRVMDAQLSIPTLIFTMILVPVVGANIMGIGFVIGIASIPGFCRSIYAQVLSLRERDFVLAADLLGQSKTNILIKHLLPNVFAQVVVSFTMSVGGAIMAEAGLAYLGVGLAAPLPAWGSMVSEGYRYLTIYPHLAIYPGIALTLLIVSLSIFGDGLRDSLDPRLRGKL